MGNALARQDSPESALPPEGQDAALRLALAEARRLAAQTRLLALNAAFEAAAAGPDEEMDALGGAAGQASAEAARVIGAVELILQQIQSASSLSGPL